MNLRINGQPHEVAHSRNVAELIHELGLPATMVLVEHNGLALRREEWTRELREGDAIELLRISAGG